jgi:methionine-gamma-lyase
MEKHSANALEVARYLSSHAKVEQVHYPGLKNHPQHDLANSQMDGYSGIIAFEIKGGREAGRILMNSVKLWTLAVSLGDVDSLIQHPATMTHVSYSEEELRETGVTGGLVRLSVGLEDVDDLIEDLDQALDQI